MIKMALIVTLTVLLGACSNINILYEKDGIKEHTEIVTNGRHIIEIDHGMIRVTAVTKPIL